MTGTYDATQLTGTAGGQTTNFITAGATIALTLDPLGSTSGHLTLPAAVTGGQPLNADLAGTWTFDAAGIHLHQSADTFLRDMVLVPSRGRLTGDGLFNSTQVHLVLTQQ